MMTHLADVVAYLRKKECNKSRKDGECDHPACGEARSAGELVAIAADLLDPAEPVEMKEAA